MCPDGKISNSVLETCLSDLCHLDACEHSTGTHECVTCERDSDGSKSDPTDVPNPDKDSVVEKNPEGRDTCLSLPVADWSPIDATMCSCVTKFDTSTEPC